MKTTFVAIDIGASSGRVIVSWKNVQDRLFLEEVHRFKNGFIKKQGHERWQMDYLIQEILIGLEKVKKAGIESCFVGIDTWAVDYCLINRHGERMAEPIAYRDSRTKSAVENFAQGYSLAKLYQKTGIQIQSFNTLFQLFVEEKSVLKEADKLLLIPDYLGYVLTGKMVTEKTNASTMQLLNVETRSWDEELLAVLGIDKKLFAPLVDPGTILGSLKKTNFPNHDLPDATVINVASHDTASAILGTPGSKDTWAYLSSGTWSLLGIETTKFELSKQAFVENYSNEWGANQSIRFLKNIMGMWLIQEVARVQEYRYSYAQLAELACKEEPLQQIIDINDIRFLNPQNMIEELQDYCVETNQKIPKTAGEIARCVYDNLALCYAKEITKIQQLTKQELQKVVIVGGGTNNHLLNQLTADYAEIVVESGPEEATAIGNILQQMLSVGEFATVEEVREEVRRSFPSQFFYPEKQQLKCLANDGGVSK